MVQKNMYSSTATLLKTNKLVSAQMTDCLGLPHFTLNLMMEEKWNINITSFLFSRCLTRFKFCYLAMKYKMRIKTELKQQNHNQKTTNRCARYRGQMHQNTTSSAQDKCAMKQKNFTAHTQIKLCYFSFECSMITIVYGLQK